MEIDVSLNKLLRILLRFLHVPQLFANLSQIFRGCSFRGQTSKFHLDERARLNQLAGVRFRAAGDGPQQRTGKKLCPLADVGTVTEPGLDHAHDFKCFEGLTQRGAANSKCLAEFSLGRDLFTLAPDSADKMAHHLTADVGGKGGSYDGSETLCLHILFHSRAKPLRGPS